MTWKMQRCMTEKRIQIFLLHKRHKLFGGESELCWKRHSSTDTSLANGKYSTDMCKLSEYFVSVTATLYFILPACKYFPCCKILKTNI